MEIFTQKEVEERSGNGCFKDMPIRFFMLAIIESDNEDDEFLEESYHDYVECTESEFLNAEGEITYERHTFFVNGVSQICLTKR